MASLGSDCIGSSTDSINILLFGRKNESNKSSFIKKIEEVFNCRSEENGEYHGKIDFDDQTIPITIHEIEVVNDKNIDSIPALSKSADIAMFIFGAENFRSYTEAKCLTAIDAAQAPFFRYGVSCAVF